jgi:hypothetical protein
MENLIPVIEFFESIIDSDFGSIVGYLFLACLLYQIIRIIYYMIHKNGQVIGEEDLDFSYDTIVDVIHRFVKDDKSYYVLRFRQSEVMTQERILVCWVYTDRGFQKFSLGDDEKSLTKKQEADKYSIGN